MTIDELISVARAIEEDLAFNEGWLSLTPSDMELTARIARCQYHSANGDTLQMKIGKVVYWGW